MDLPQCRGAQHDDGLLALYILLFGMIEKRLEGRWCGRAPVETRGNCVHRGWRNCPFGRDLKNEAAKPTTFDVLYDLRGDVVLSLKLLGEKPIGPTPEICKDRRIIWMSTPLFGELQVC